ncbi:MAG: hypothetical protein WC673_01800 [Candidatus Paceibacterota bacterium]
MFEQLTPFRITELEVPLYSGSTGLFRISSHENSYRQIPSPLNELPLIRFHIPAPDGARALDIPTTVIGYTPAGVEGSVEIVIVGAQGGVQEAGEKDAELFGGNPETLKETGVGVPDVGVGVVVIVFETELP